VHVLPLVYFVFFYFALGLFLKIMKELTTQNCLLKYLENQFKNY